MDMTFEGLGEMFECNFADTCINKNSACVEWGPNRGTSADQEQIKATDKNAKLKGLLPYKSLHDIKLYHQNTVDIDCVIVHKCIASSCFAFFYFCLWESFQTSKLDLTLSGYTSYYQGPFLFLIFNPHLHWHNFHGGSDFYYILLHNTLWKTVFELSLTYLNNYSCIKSTRCLHGKDTKVLMDK